MKAFKCYSMAAFVAVAGALASCSSDDDITNGGDESIASNKVITTTISNEDAETRLGIEFKGNKNTLSKNDVIWAYSAKTQWFNKLIPNFGDEDEGLTEIAYQSEGTTKFAYEENSIKGEELLIIYTGDRTTHTAAYEGSAETVTLTKPTHSHDAVLIHGAKDSIPYFDKNNSYSFKAANGYVLSNGHLYGLGIITNKKDGTPGEVDLSTNPKTGKYTGLGKKINLITYMPLLRFNIPSATPNTKTDDTEVDEVLSKLDYKIIIDAVPSDATAESGYPQSVTFTKITKTTPASKSDTEQGRDYQRCFLLSSVETGESMKLYYKAGVDVDDEGVTNGKYEPSKWLWRTSTNYTENYESSKTTTDKYQGYIYIPVAPTDYKLVRIRVNVSCPDETLKAKLSDTSILGTYEYSNANIKLGYDKTESDHKGLLNVVYDLGAIWEHSTAITVSSAPAKGNAPRLAPASVKAGEGWTKVVDDAEFDF